VSSIKGGRTRPPVANPAGEPAEVARPSRLGAVVVGCFFLCTASVHVGIVMADPGFYGSFGDAALFGLVRRGWSELFMAHPASWGLAVAAGEAVLGALLLLGGRAARVGWIGVLTFHVLLMLFGYGFWLWSVPALALFGWLAARDWPLNGTNKERRRTS
jgi:hypothetical protein